jgi:hypothetical protein
MTATRFVNKRTIAMVMLAAAGAIVLVAFLVQRAGPSSAGAADHLDAPGLTPPGGSVQTDVTDVYAFRSPANPNNTVLALNVNGVASAGEAAPGPDRPFAQAIPLVKTSSPVTYNLHVDNNGDAVTDVDIEVAFGAANANGSQAMRVKLEGARGGEELEGQSTAFGAAPTINRGAGGITAFAGRRDDPFFFDLVGFLNILDLGGRSLVGCGSPTSHPERNFFAHRNVSSIVLEVPSRLLTAGSAKIGVWGSTNMPGLQIDRMGRPAIATVFIPNNPIPPDRVSDGKSSLKSTYNHSDPVNDQANFRGEVTDTLQFLFSLNDPATGLGGTDDPSDDAAKISGLADFLLPDILTVDTSSSAGFPNGRRLNDDVIDTELGLVTEGFVTTDCVAADNDLPSTFPYLGRPN